MRSRTSKKLWRKSLDRASQRDMPLLRKTLQGEVNKRVRERDGRCMVRHSHAYKERYGECSGLLNASHIYATGSYPMMRFDTSNIMAKCAGHHKGWWHMKTAESWAWLREHWGEERFEALRIKARDTYISRLNDPKTLRYLIEVIRTRPDDYESEYEALIPSRP